MGTRNSGAHVQVLHVKEEDPRRETYKSALQVGSNVTASTRAALIRMKM
jgi:hypothetical protein